MFNWRGAVLLAAAWLALAWTQAFTQSGPGKTEPGKADRIMTLYEKGRPVPCKVIGSWVDGTGSKAYQLQSLETGELITIVEAGSAAAPSDGGRRTVRTRNFHWGVNARTPPSGCPAPPTDIMTACAECGGPRLESEKTTLVSSTPVKTEYIWWEEKDGKRSSPEVVTSGSNPFAPKGVVPPPGSDPTTVIVTGPGVAAPGGVTAASGAVDPSKPGVKNALGDDRMPGGVTTAVGRDSAPIVLPASAGVSTGPCCETVTPAYGPTVVQSTPKRFGDRVRDFFAPKATTTTAANPAIPKRTPWPEFSTAGKTTPVVVRPATGPTPDPAPLTMGPATPPPVVLPPTAPPSAPPAPSALAGAAKTPATDPASSDWRKMWGKGETPTVQPPGASLVSAVAKPGSGPVSGVVPASGSPLGKDDILMRPERFDPTTKRFTPGTETGMRPTELPSTLPAGGEPLSPPTGPYSVPLGAQSVIAAKSGLTGPVTYVPVPVTTVPEPYRPPMPPPPNVPSAPNPTAFVNAFTPPAAPGMAAAPTMPYPPMLPPGMNPAMMNPAMMNPAMMNPAMNPGFNPAMMNPGMAPAAFNPAMMNPAMAAAPLPYGYAPVAPAGGSMYSTPRYYTGPTPPSPIAMAPPSGPVMPVGYTAPAPAPVSEISQLLMVLRESPYPAQRSWAANQLGTFDWRGNPEVLPALIQAARHDPAATVRSDCVYGLSRINAATQPVVETLQSLRSDSDARVRQEVENALVRMGVK
ncbi:MAG: HEAT repeat domain-containing protein [Gemmataceae bacterium]